MTATPEDLFAFLNSIGVETRTTEHAPVFTVAESQDLRGTLPGGHTKNLFLEDKNGRLYLATCLEHRKFRIKDLEKTMGAAKCSFGKPERLMEALGVTPGSVTIFGLINDRAARRVRVGIDKGLLEHDPINGHPLHNAATTAIAPADLLKFVRACGHEPMIIDFDALEAAAAAAG